MKTKYRLSYAHLLLCLGLVSCGPGFNNPHLKAPASINANNFMYYTGAGFPSQPDSQFEILGESAGQIDDDLIAYDDSPDDETGPLPDPEIYDEEDFKPDQSLLSSSELDDDNHPYDNGSWILEEVLSWFT
jgi:hypothetical protein